MPGFTSRRVEGVLGFQHGSDRGTGDLFQSPFASVVIDDGHLVRAVQYVSLHPARAKRKRVVLAVVMRGCESYVSTQRYVDT